jgi:hypothetical protein
MDSELVRGRDEERFLPALTEKTVAWTRLERIPLVAGRPVALRVDIVAPDDAQPGTSFYLHIEQEVNGDVTGAYTVVVTIV